MATRYKRAANILEAFNDTVPTDERVTNVIDAFAYTYRRGENLTQAEKATEFIKQVRQYTRQIVKDYNQSLALKTFFETNNFDIDLGVD